MDDKNKENQKVEKSFEELYSESFSNIGKISLEDSLEIDSNNQDLRADMSSRNLPNKKKTTGNGGLVVSLLLTWIVLLSLGGFVLYEHLYNNSQNGNYPNENNQTVEIQKDPPVTKSSLPEVVKKIENTVVEIRTEAVTEDVLFGNHVQQGAGSGVIISADGYIVTNNHVVDKANKIQISLKNGEIISGKLIATDPISDLAVVKIEKKGLEYAQFGDSSTLKVGEPAIVIGNPLGELGGTVSTGIISALDRKITLGNQSFRLLQTDAAVNEGNSGGGLFNDQGQLVGIVVAKKAGAKIEGLGFAIPSNIAKEITTSLIKNGKIEGRAAIGILLEIRELQGTNKNTIVIKELITKEAKKSELKPDDIILNIDNIPVDSFSKLNEILNEHKAGEKVKITVKRGNTTQDIELILSDKNELNK